MINPEGCKIKYMHLELSLAGQATLPSDSCLQQQDRPYARRYSTYFQLLVNQRRGAAQYESQDQAFSFHKQVRFEDNEQQS